MSRFICRLSAVVAVMVGCGVANAATAPVTLNLTVQLAADLGVEQISGGVSKWNDQSGNGNFVKQDTANQRPTLVTGPNGLPVVRFDGELLLANQYDYMVGTTSASGMVSTTGYTTFVVYKADLVNRFTASPAYTNDELFGDAGAAGANWGVFLNNSSPKTIYGYNNGNSAQVPFTVGSYTLASTRLEGGRIYTSVFGGGSNDVLSSNVPTPVAATLGLGRGYDVGAFATTTIFKGDIAEILIYNRTLNPTERSSVESYLNTKWLVAAAVPEPSSAGLLILGAAFVARRRSRNRASH